MRTFLIALILVAVSPFDYSDCASSGKEKLLWKTNLRKQGFAVHHLSPPGARTANRQITFGSNGELVVANAGAMNWTGPFGGYVLDTSSGEILNKVYWGGTRGRPYIFSSHKGEYVVNVYSGLELYSAELRTIKLAMPYSVNFASPDGSSFAAWKRMPGPHGVTYFLDAQTLKPTGVQYLDKYIWSICQDRAAYVTVGESSHHVRVDGPSGTVYVYSTDCSEPRPNFVSKDVLAVFGCDRVDVIDTSEGLLFSYPTMAHVPYLSGASRDGSRFVIGEPFYGLGDDPKLRYEQFTIIDIARREAVLSVRIKKLRGRRDGNSGAALSPDGSLLAVNSLGIVQLFQIPERDIDGSEK